MKTKRQQPTQQISLLSIVAITVMIVGSVVIFWQANKHAPLTPVATPYISFSEIQTLLGHEWVSVERWQYEPLEDLKGRPRSLLKRTGEGFYHVDNRLAFIRISVMIYSDKISAAERYKTQDDVIFYQLDRQQHRWSDTHIVKQATSNANSHHAKCKYISDDNRLKEIHCSAILQYAHYVIVVNMFPHRDYQQYIDEAKMVQMFEIIDHKMLDVLAESASS